MRTFNSAKTASLLGIVLVFGGPCVAWAADVSSATIQGEIADWPLIQSKGGIKLGRALQHTADSWELPLLCDLSADASGIVIKKTMVEQAGGYIYISLVIGHTVWTLTPQRGQCKTLIITSNHGVHPVFYRDAAGKTFLIGYAEFNLDSTILSNPSG
jgi:hypothetical protein